MCSPGRRPTAALREKQRHDEHWRWREEERRWSKVSVGWSSGGALGVESQRKKKERG
jgi:hypothetical protein